MKDNKFIEIRKSKIEGLGVFALKNFKKGEQIYFFKKGKVVRQADIQKLPTAHKRYLDKLSENKYEIIESPARYVNHSCSPNIVEKDRIGYALRDIAKGEELTIDYDKIAYLDRPFRCNCGAKDCRGFVRGRQ